MAVVAGQAGVSVATVSRVLNRDTRVSPDARERVERVIREIGYTPNAAARSLRSRATRQLSLVVDDIGNPAYVEIMRAMQDVARESGFRLLVQSTDGRADDELAILQALGQRYVDGLVLTSISFTPEVVGELADTAVPVVVIGSVPEGVPVDTVSAAAAGGARAAVLHLAEQGGTRFAMVNGPAETRPAVSRLQGFRDGLVAIGAAAEPVVLHTAFTAEAGYEAATALLSRDERPDSILCANDQLAVGVVDACADQGIAVPGDIAVVGMDNTRDAELCRPRLSSVDLRFRDRGRIAGQMLLERIDGRYDGAVRRVQLDTDLVQRESSLRHQKEG
jgi:LacI family transcriptional regulator